MKAVNTACKKAVAEAKLQHWEAKAKDKPGDLRTMWQSLKIIKRAYNPPDHDLTTADGRVLQSLEEKAQGFLQYFASASTTAELPLAQQQLRREGEEAMDLSPPSGQDEPLTYFELTRALRGIRSTKSSPGGDRITYPLLKKLPSPYLKMLLALFNKCWREGTVPPGLERRHRCTSPQGQQAKEGGEQLPTSLPHISSRKAVRANHAGKASALHSAEEPPPQVSGRLPQRTKCHWPHSEAWWTHEEGASQKECHAVVLLRHCASVWHCLARQAPLPAQVGGHITEPVSIHQFLSHWSHHGCSMEKYHLPKEDDWHWSATGVRHRPYALHPYASRRGKRPPKGHHLNRWPNKNGPRQKSALKIFQNEVNTIVRSLRDSGFMLSAQKSSCLSCQREWAHQTTCKSTSKGHP